jgi:hypothetical protein
MKPSPNELGFCSKVQRKGAISKPRRILDSGIAIIAVRCAPVNTLAAPAKTMMAQVAVIPLYQMPDIHV